jgi:hypothetical protein
MSVIIKKDLVACRVLPSERKKLELIALNRGITLSEVLRELINQA